MNQCFVVNTQNTSFATFSGGYCEGPHMADLVKENILLLCSELKPEAIAITDALAPPDFVLNSVLGMSDGKVYL